MDARSEGCGAPPNTRRGGWLMRGASNLARNETIISGPPTRAGLPRGSHTRVHDGTHAPALLLPASSNPELRNHAADSPPRISHHKPEASESRCRVSHHALWMLLLRVARRRGRAISYKLAGERGKQMGQGVATILRAVSLARRPLRALRRWQNTHPLAAPVRRLCGRLRRSAWAGARWGWGASPPPHPPPAARWR